MQTSQRMIQYPWLADFVTLRHVGSWFPNQELNPRSLILNHWTTWESPGWCYSEGPGTTRRVHGTAVRRGDAGFRVGVGVTAVGGGGRRGRGWAGLRGGDPGVSGVQGMSRPLSHGAGMEAASPGRARHGTGEPQLV